MAERRKIVIQTGEGMDEPLPTPHFDAEATLTARPVVPLNDQEARQVPYGDYAGRAPKPFWKRPALLVAIVLAAIGVGVAAGLAIGLYRNRNAAETPLATAPTPAVENTDLNQTVEPKPTPEERAALVPEQPEEEPAVEPKEDAVEPKEEERERTTARNERRDNDDNEESQPVVAKPPRARDRKPVKVDEYVIEDERAEREAEREQRREERRAARRERRRRGDNEISIPRGIQRAGREVDRIREIFEGRQP
jgi:type IV secretory pathway VirB10-like protein